MVSLLWLGLCILPKPTYAQTALFRLLLPAKGDEFESKRKKTINRLQVRLQKLEAKMDARKRRAAIDKQIFDKELLEYNQLLARHRRPMPLKYLDLVRWQQKLQVLAQECVNDLMRIQSVDRLIEQSRVDLQEALRLELDALLQLTEYLRKHYPSTRRPALLQRIENFKKLLKQRSAERKQISQDRARLAKQKDRNKKRLDVLRRKLGINSIEQADPPVSTKTKQPTSKNATSSRPSQKQNKPVVRKQHNARYLAWRTKVQLLRLNRYRIRIRLLQMLQKEELLNDKVAATRIRFYQHSIQLMQQHAKRLARLSEGGLLFVSTLPLNLDWSRIAEHTRSLRRQGLDLPSPYTRTPRNKYQVQDASWLSILLFLSLATLLVLLLYRLSQRAIDRLTKRAQEERLLLRLWRFVRLCLRLARDAISWLLLLLPLLWLLRNLFEGSVWWDFAKHATWQLLFVRLSLTVCQRLFHSDPNQRLLPDITTKGAKRLRRILSSMLLFHVIAYPSYTLLKLLQYPKPLLAWVFVIYLTAMVGGFVFLLLQRDTILSLMLKNTMMERILIVVTYRLYPLVVLTPIVLFGLYIWGYQNLAGYLSKGLSATLGLALMTDLLTTILWGVTLWLLGFTNEDESLLVEPPQELSQVQIDPTEGGPTPSTETSTTGSTPEGAPTEGVVPEGTTLEATTLGTEPTEVDPMSVVQPDGVAAPTSEGEPSVPAETPTQPVEEVASVEPQPVSQAQEVQDKPSETPASSEKEPSSSVASDNTEKPPAPTPAESPAAPPKSSAPAVPAIALEAGHVFVTPDGLRPDIVPYFRTARILYMLVITTLWIATLSSILAAWQVPGGIRALPIMMSYPIFQASDLQITLWIMLQVFALFAFTLWLSRIIPDLFNEYLYPTFRVSPASSYVTNALTRYFVISLGVFLCMRLLQVGSRGFLILLAVVGLSLSYGLRRLMHNFISSLIILFGRPISIGDYIETGKLKGKVQKITARSTTLQTASGKMIIIPNGRLLDGPITNWLVAKPYFREKVIFHVALDTDVDMVHKILMQVAKENPDVQAKPLPVVRLREMNSKSLEMSISVTLLNPMAGGRIRSNIRLAVLKKFREANIELALPQQELHLHPDIEAGLLQQLYTDKDENEEPIEIVPLMPPNSRWQVQRTAHTPPAPPKDSGSSNSGTPTG